MHPQASHSLIKMNLEYLNNYNMENTSKIRAFISVLLTEGGEGEDLDPRKASAGRLSPDFYEGL